MNLLLAEEEKNTTEVVLEHAKCDLALDEGNAGEKERQYVLRVRLFELLT